MADIPRILLTRKEAAEALAMSVDQLDVLIRRGELSFVPISADPAGKRTHVRLHVSDIERFVRRRKASQAPAVARRSKRRRLAGVRRFFDADGRLIEREGKR